MQQRRKNNIVQHANERGIFAIRRPLSPDSQQLLHRFSCILQSELHNSGRLFNPRSLGVTVVGFSRFNKRHKGIGPPTKRITAEVESCHHPINNVRLGSLAIFGSSFKGKLGINLISEELVNEAANLEGVFKEKGFPLRKDPNGDSSLTPHCSIALLYNDNLGHFQDDRTLAKLTQMIGLEKGITQSITLDPVSTRPTS